MRQPRLHRHAGQHAAVGRAPGRRRLHRAAAAAARARRALAGDQPDPLAAVVRRRSRPPTASCAQRCDTVFAVGLSMGGTLVTRLAEQHPDDVAGLVLVNPAYGTQRFDAKFAPYISWAVRSRPAIGGDIKKPGVDEPAGDRTPVDRVRVAAEAVEADRAPTCGEVRAPILMYRSREDHVVDTVVGAAAQGRRGQHHGRARSCSRTATTSPRSTTTRRRSSPAASSSSSRSPPARPVVGARRPSTDPGEPAAASRRASTTGCMRRAYVPLTDVDPAVGAHLLTALGRARIAAYLDRQRAARQRPAPAVRRLRRARRRPHHRRRRRPRARRGRRRRRDAAGADAAHATRSTARRHRRRVRRAGRRLARRHRRRGARRRARPDPRGRRLAGPAEQAAGRATEVWLDEDHYVPPPPPPLPRLAGADDHRDGGARALDLVLGLGGQIGLANELSWCSASAG